MIADFDDFCTWMYVLISDAFVSIAPRLARPGPAPACSDAELLTMAVVGECMGWDQETVLISQWRQHRDLFPVQPDRTRFNRRRRALGQALNLLRHAVLALLDIAQERRCAIDSLPIPVVQFYWAPQASSEWRCQDAAFGHCCAKKQTIFGYKLHLLVTLGGVIRDFELAPANLSDLTVGVELLAEQRHLEVWGAKPSSVRRLPRNWRAPATFICTPCPGPTRRPPSPPWRCAAPSMAPARSSRRSTAS